MKIAQQEKQPRVAEECVLFDKCSAPVCPVASGGVWYSDEDICHNPWFNKDKIIRNQKKLRKVKATGVFTREKLINMKRIGKTTKGETVK